MFGMAFPCSTRRDCFFAIAMTSARRSRRERRGFGAASLSAAMI
jgi:hypothetical protein